MTKGAVIKTLRSNEDAAIYVWHGETYLDDGESVQMIPVRVFCALYRDGCGDITPIDDSNSVYQAKG